jgi:dTDP-4-dehydrorhamnose reductase
VLQRMLAPLGMVTAVGRHDCDLMQPQAIRALVTAVRPDIIVNPAAYTAVDKAEAEPDIAFAVNAVAPRVLAEEAAKVNALLIHYSTDYVFDGSKPDAYTELDSPAPQSVYGKSKLAGEEAIRHIGCRHLILRTSWVFGAHGANFLKTILRLSNERDSLRIVADQIGAPTSAATIADITAQVLGQYIQSQRLAKEPEPTWFGIYHLTATGETSWHGYAQFVVRLAAQLGMPLKLRADEIVPISTSEYPLPAPRPANSRLNTEKLQSTFGIALPDWQVAVTDVLNQLVIT